MLRVVRPFMNAHLGREQIDSFRGSIFFRVLSLTKEMYANRGFVRVSRGPDDVLRTESTISPKEHFGVLRLECFLVQHRTIPFIKIHTQISFDPRTMVILSNRHQNMIALNKLIGLAGGHIF